MTAREDWTFPARCKRQASYYISNLTVCPGLVTPAKLGVCSAPPSRTLKRRVSPPWKGGVAAPIKKMPRSILSGRRRGGRFNHRLSEVEPTTPSAPSKERDHLVDGAATPPFQGGDFACPPVLADLADDLCVTINPQRRGKSLIRPPLQAASFSQ